MNGMRDVGCGVGVVAVVAIIYIIAITITITIIPAVEGIEEKIRFRSAHTHRSGTTELICFARQQSCQRMWYFRVRIRIRIQVRRFFWLFN